MAPGHEFIVMRVWVDAATVHVERGGQSFEFG